MRWFREGERNKVSSSTDLIQLLSYAGGSVQYAKMDEVVITRLTGSEGTLTNRLIVLDLDNLASVNRSRLALFPGDTIFIDHTGWLTLRDIFSVFSTAAIITAAIALLMIASNR